MTATLSTQVEGPQSFVKVNDILHMITAALSTLFATVAIILLWRIKEKHLFVFKVISTFNFMCSSLSSFLIFAYNPVFLHDFHEVTLLGNLLPNSGAMNLEIIYMCVSDICVTDWQLNLLIHQHFSVAYPLNNRKLVKYSLCVFLTLTGFIHCVITFISFFKPLGELSDFVMDNISVYSMIVFQFTRTLGLAVLVVLNLRQQYLLGTSSERVRGLFAIFVRATIVACTITALLMRMTPSVLIIIYLLGYGHVGAYISLIAFTGMSNFFLFQFIFTVVYIKPFHIKLTLFFQRLFKNKIFAYKQQPIVATIC